MKGLSMTAPLLLCMVGLLLSFEYRGEKLRTLLWVCRGLSVAVLAAGAAGWFVAMPQWAVFAVNAAAVLVNLPLAGLGMAKHKK